MRKCNVWLVRLILPLLLVHGLWGSFTLLGINAITIKPLSWLLLVLVVLHGLIGLLLSRDAIRTGLRTGRWYWKENARYWVIRVSGICIFVLLGFHICAYTVTVNGVLFLREFTFLRMLSQLLFLASILIHLLAAVRPWLINRGILKFRERSWDCLAVLTILAAFFTFSIVSYYIYWNF